jgi:hypothetical protein
MSCKGAKNSCSAVIVDETQDLDVQRLALIRLLAGKGRYGEHRDADGAP